MGSEKVNALDTIIENAYVAMGKKLTTKTRKALPDKVFCGPGRSFPCQDCAHVRAAKVYLGRSKFSKSTKKKIAACINRRAKLLKCGVTKKAKAGVKGLYPKYVELLKDERSLYSSEDFKSTKKLVDQSLKSPGLDIY